MKRLAIVLRIAVLAAMLLTLIGLPAAPVAAARPMELAGSPAGLPGRVLEPKAGPGPEAVSWCAAGDFNGWDNTSTVLVDDGTQGDVLAGDGIYSRTLSLAAAQTYTWKAVTCGDWSVAYPTSNSWFITTAAGQVVTLLLDTNDHTGDAGMALQPAVNIVNVIGDTLPTSYTVVGEWQGWDPSDPATLMTDLGNGYQRLVYSIPTAGSYSGKVVVTGGWDGFGADGRSVLGVYLDFTTSVDNEDVVFLLDTVSGRLLIEPAASGAGTWCAAGGFNGWTFTPLLDDGTGGDLLGGDGVFTADVTVPDAGRSEWKVTDCTWDVSHPGANSWLFTAGAGQVVKLSFDTNDHSADAGPALLPAVNILHAWDSAAAFTAVGDWQGWNNANPATALTGVGPGLYRLDAAIAAPGTYQYKVVQTGSWDAIGGDYRSVNAANIPFTTYTAGDVVSFLLDYRTSRVGAFAPPAPTQAGHDNEIWWGELGHNSRDTLYRNPGGPVTTGTPVTLRLRAASGDLTAARLRLYNDRTNVQSLLDMSLVLDDGTYEWWEATVPASPDPTVYWYRFIAIDGTDTNYYEDDAARTMGWGETFDETNDYSYQLTVYGADFQTPDWIKNAIVYQVFPDRFRDGDATNNKPAGTFFYNEPGGTISRSLTTNWNEEVCDPRAAGACAGTYSKNFYGGDLAGLLAQLDYIEGLGVNTIYLNPIFESPSNHGYDTTDYLAVNPIFGTPADFNALVSEINSRGMHLILDGVFNHVSSDSIYFDRYNQYTEDGACESSTSPYRSWFYFTPADPPGSGPCVGDDGSAGGSDYESWWGYDSLPKLRANEAPVRELIWDYDTDPTTTVAGYWMQSADGWRLDVGADVDPGTINDPANDYWEGFRATVQAANPDGYITGEEWGIANSWLLGGEWDAVMNYQFSSAVLSYWRDESFVDNDHNPGSSAGELAPLNAAAFDERIQNLMERYAPEALLAMLNLFGSHDTSRVLFMLDHNADLNDPSLYANPDYDWSDAINRLKGAVIVQMTMPGAPTIYYGDEVGLVGPMAYSAGKWEDDPYNRQPYPWLDLGAADLPFYTSLQSQTNQDALYDYYATLTAARNAHPALATGDYRTLLVDDTAEWYVYGRRLDGSDAALVFINRSDTPASISVNLNTYLPYDSSFVDVLTLSPYTAVDNILSDVQVPANGGAVLVATSPVTAAPDPTVLSVGGVGDTWVTLNWTGAAGANGYYVYRTRLSGGGYELLGATAGLSYTDTTALPGQTYYYMVKSHNGTTGLLGEPSNEVSAMPHYTIGWANLQWPPTLTKTINATPTDNVYGQVYISGVTLEPGATPGLLAQAGFGPDGTDPDGHAGWIWVDAAFNGQAGMGGENDEFVAAFMPEATGAYDYAYRYSTDGGATWLYADLDSTDNGYAVAQAGVLTVNASADDTPPTTPVLAIADWGANHIDLSWTAADDDQAVYAYDLYRSTDGLTYGKIARILAPTLTYADAAVVTGTLYYYQVQAVDTSFNFGGFSDPVSHLAEPKQVAVTFEVTVPAFTPGTVYLTRFINPDGTLGGWDPAATPLLQQSTTLWQQTFNLLDGTVVEFKFTRGSWETVVKGADGNTELPNLTLTVDYGTDGTQLYQYTVPNWRDPLVTAFTPGEDALDIPPATTITTTWSQAMAPDTCLTLSDGVTPLTGQCVYDDPTKTVTFTPDASLAYATPYTVSVTGQVDAAGDVQQVPVAWSFTTAAAPAGVVLTPETAAQSGGPGTAVTYTLTVENTGDLADTFDITLDSLWPGTPTVTEIALAPDATGTFDVVVTVPAGALAGAADTATVTVTSQSDDTATDSAALTTTASAVYGVSLTPATAAAAGDPGTQVGYTLTVANTGNTLDDFTLAADGADWTTLIVPTTLTDLAPGDTAEVSVTVTIPAGAGSGEFDDVGITVTSGGDPTVSAGAVLTTTANQVAGVTLTPETAAGSGLPGTSHTYTLTVENTGNAADVFDVAVESIWTSTPSVTEITLAAGFTGNFDVVVTIPAGALAGAADTATVTVTSQADDTAADSAALTTTASAVRGVAITPTTMAGWGLPGQEVLYLLTVHNTGNIDDTYLISANGSWDLATDPATAINVAAGSTAVLRVTITVPLDAADGDVDTAVVAVISQGDGAVSDASTLTTTAFWLKLNLPLILK